MTKIKLIDVAEAAGVSKSTVSQFLNGRYNYMSKGTRTRIEKAVAELNYVPNAIARSLKTDRTMTVGVVVRDIAGSYTSRAIRGMDDYCKRNGYNLLIYNSDFDATTEANALKSLQQLRVDGIIIAPSGLNDGLLRDDPREELPVVHFQLERDGLAQNVIVSDYRQGAFDATQYLLKLGHTRIGFLTQQFEQVKSRKERFQGYVDALEAQGIAVDHDLVLFWHRERGFSKAPVQVLAENNPPTALFAQHLAITTDLLEELAAASIQIPDEVSVLGFDDVPMAQFFKVPITVVKQQPYKVGAETAKLLIDRIQNPTLANQRITIPCALVKRASCKNLHSQTVADQPDP